MERAVWASMSAATGPNMRDASCIAPSTPSRLPDNLRRNSWHAQTCAASAPARAWLHPFNSLASSLPASETHPTQIQSTGQFDRRRPSHFSNAVHPVSAMSSSTVSQTDGGSGSFREGPAGEVRERLTSRVDTRFRWCSSNQVRTHPLRTTAHS
jgi:hypothetical protein